MDIFFHEESNSWSIGGLWYSMTQGENMLYHLNDGASDVLSPRTEPDSKLADAVEKLREMIGADCEHPDALRARFRQEIEGWQWDAIKRTAEENAEPDNKGDEGGRIGRDFLGTVFSLFPSGKYYQPWAAGNVDSCGRCGGPGTVRNDAADPAQGQMLYGIRATLTRFLLDFHGARCEGRWPTYLSSAVSAIDAAREAVRDSLPCPHCEGEGSREVLEDSIFQEELESVADAHGMSIESGEGDPCDIFAILYLEPKHPRIKVTFETVTEESAREGDAADRGWIDEEGESMLPDSDDEEEGISAVDKAVSWLEDKGALEPSGMPFYPGIWYTQADAQMTREYIEDGKDTRESFHLEDFTEEEERAIYGRLFPRHADRK